MKIIKRPFSIVIIALLIALIPVQYVHASTLVTNCVQVSTTDGVDSDSTPGDKANAQAIDDAVGATPPSNEDDESCVKVLIPFDYGDAPDSPDQSAPEPDYPTLTVSDGARHQLGTDVFLGQCVDSDLGDAAQNALDDDETPATPYWGECTEPDDEDGVVLGDLVVGSTGSVAVTASKDCKLNAWVDWDADGSWTGVTEQIFVDEQLVAGVNALTLAIPTLAVAGETYARFRCSTVGGDGISGEAADGEVEDYKVAILPAVDKVGMSLGDFIWLDDNKDGLQSSGEFGLVDAQVSLLNADGTPARDVNGILVAAQTIDATGAYQFDSLPEGDYILSVLPPEGYVPTLGGFDPDTNDSNEDNNCLVTDEGIRTPVLTLRAGNEPVAGIDGDDANSDMTVDCGFHRSETPKYSIGNQIWLDNGGGNAANANNGIKDLGEPRTTQAIQVELWDAANNVLQGMTSNDGYYLFSDLEAGDYKVCLTAANFKSSGALAGYGSSLNGDETDANLDVDNNDNGSNDTALGVCSGVVTLGDGEPLNESPTFGGQAGNDSMGTPDNQSNLTVDFGLIPPADPIVPVYVGNYIWNDLDEDGVQDAGENGLSNVQVSLLQIDGSPAIDLNGQSVSVQTTGVDGRYQFNQLPEGTYSIRFVPPTGFVPTLGGADADINTSDADSNCHTEGTDIVTSVFILATGTEPDTAIDGDGTHGNLTVDCGLYQPKSLALSLGNYVWNDVNADGLQDDSETGLVGVTVSITDDAGNTVNDIYGKPVPAQTTDANGFYRFDDLPEGDYVVYMEPPTGYFVSVGGGDVDENDSNTDNNCHASAAGLVLTYPLSLTENAEPVSAIDGDDANGNLTVDCGFHRTLSVGNYIWNDANANGLQDGGESGLAGMMVSLTSSDGVGSVQDINGQTVPPFFTDSSGLYLFTNLVPGEYRITVTPPEDGYSLSPGGADPDSNASDSDSNCALDQGEYITRAFRLPLAGKQDVVSIDCGFYRSVGVGSRIWIDMDADGLQDPTEPGVPQATVTLLTPDGQPVTDLRGWVVEPQLTGANGDYFFGGLKEGDYIVQVTPPAGYEPTKASGDPDDDNGQDSNGTSVGNGFVSSSPITLSWGNEPDNDGDDDKSTNLTVGFGFTAKTFSESVHIPTASGWMLGLMSLLLSAIAFWRRRRDGV